MLENSPPEDEPGSSKPTFPRTKTPDGSWELPAPKFQVVHNVDIIYVNINSSSDFGCLRTGTEGSVHEAITQVCKHVQRGLYRVVSLNASEHSCVVVVSTTLPREDLVWKHGFPWDIPEDPQPEIVL
jgi:hypothetical protein